MGEPPGREVPCPSRRYSTLGQRRTPPPTPPHPPLPPPHRSSAHALPHQGEADPATAGAFSVHFASDGTVKRFTALPAATLHAGVRGCAVLVADSGAAPAPAQWLPPRCPAVAAGGCAPAVAAELFASALVAGAVAAGGAPDLLSQVRQGRQGRPCVCPRRVPAQGGGGWGVARVLCDFSGARLRCERVAPPLLPLTARPGARTRPPPSAGTSAIRAVHPFLAATSPVRCVCRSPCPGPRISTRPLAPVGTPACTSTCCSVFGTCPARRRMHRCVCLCV